MSFLERQRHVLAAPLDVRPGVPHARAAEGLVHDLPRGHPQSRMLGPQPTRELADDEVVLPALSRRLDDLPRDLEVRVAARGVEVVVLEEHGRGEHDVGIGGRLGQELLVDAQEQVLPRETLVHQVELGAHHRGIRVLDEHGRDGRPAVERLGIAGQDRPEPRLVERADRPVHAIQALDEAAIRAGRGPSGRRPRPRPGAATRPSPREARDRVHLRGPRFANG